MIFRKLWAGLTLRPAGWPAAAVHSTAACRVRRLFSSRENPEPTQRGMTWSLGSSRRTRHSASDPGRVAMDVQAPPPQAGHRWGHSSQECPRALRPRPGLTVRAVDPGGAEPGSPQGSFILLQVARFSFYGWKVLHYICVYYTYISHIFLSIHQSVDM